jgi:uncharacterized membrane protein
MILLSAATILSLVAIPNHYFFRTYALDYGVFNQALYTYSVGDSALFTQGWAGDESNYLCDHFSPLTILLSPLRYVFGTYALLLIQIFSILVSCFFMWKLSKDFTSDRLVQYLFAFSPLCIWGVHGAISSEFHMNVVAAALFPAIYYYIIKEKFWKVAVFSIVALLCKENVGLNLCVLFVAALIENRYRPAIRRLAGVSALVSLAFFFVCIFWVSTLYCGTITSNSQTFYDHFGPNLREAFYNMISNPGEMLKLSYQDFEGNIAKAKMTSLWFILLSGGMFVIVRPAFAIPMAAFLAQKFLSSNQLLWDTNGHYSIEIAMLIPIALVSSLRIDFIKRYQRIVIIPVLGLALFMSWRGIISRNLNANLFSKQHYTSLVPQQEFAYVTALIDTHDVISCSTDLSPHLSFRKKVFVFPVIKDSNWIVLNKRASIAYPLRLDEFQEEIRKLKYNSEFEILYESNCFLLLKRITVP